MSTQIIILLKKSWMFLANILVTLLLITILMPSQGVPGSSGAPGSSGPAGSDGLPGSNGVDGEDGSTPYIGNNQNWWIDEIDTGVSASGIANQALDPETYVRHDMIQDAIDRKEAYVNEHTVISNQTTYVRELIDNQNYLGVSTPLQFLSIDGNDQGLFVLTNDIDFQGVSWVPMGPFRGILDGAGYRLLNLDKDNITSDLDASIALFTEIEDAEIKNLTIENFNFDFPMEEFGNNNLAFLSVTARRSTFANIDVIASTLSGGQNVGMLMVNAEDSQFYDIHFENNVLKSEMSLGGLASELNAVSLIGITVNAMTIHTAMGYSGAVAGSVYNSIAAQITVENSRTVIFPSIAIENAASQNIGMVIGYAYESQFRFVRVEESQIKVEPAEARLYYEFLNIGGFVGYGQLVSISDVVVVNALIPIIIFPSLTVIGTNPVIEYVGGVAGYLKDYVLMKTSNQAGLGVMASLSDYYDTIEDVAGVLGYSSGNGFMYQVSNYGFVLGGVGVGGILGGVGFVQVYGSIQMIQVANYGAIYGMNRVGGIYGSIDGLTSLSITHALQHSVVIGSYAVGGIGGMTASFSYNVNIDIDSVVVLGQVFGFEAVGGAFGLIDTEMMNAYGKISLSTILIENEVQSMLVGMVIGEDVIELADYFNFGEPFIIYQQSVGQFIGMVYRPIALSQIFLTDQRITQPVFTINAGNVTYLERSVTGRYLPIWRNVMGNIYSQRAIGEWFEDPLVSFLFSSTFWIKDDTGFTLKHIEAVNPNLLDASGRMMFFLSYYQIIFSNLME